MLKDLPLDAIRLDGGTQPRVAIDRAVWADYADAMQEGATFPPVTVFFDGDNYWLADGFHRVTAANHIGKQNIAASVIEGSVRDAILHSVGANGEHGLRRSNEDKRHAVMTLLQDDEWRHWDDRKIAVQCGVHHSTVHKYRSTHFVGNRQMVPLITKRPLLDRVDLRAFERLRADPILDSDQEVARLARMARERQAQVADMIASGKAKNVKEAAREIAQAEARQQAAKNAAKTPESIDVRMSDCLDMLASVKEGSISLLLTDPPYFVTENEWDQWPTEREYFDFMAQWLSAALPKMAKQSNAFIFCDAGYTLRIGTLLEDLGWPVQRQCIWHRPNLAKKRSGALTFLSSYEPFWHCGTRALNFPDVWGAERFDVQTFVAPQSNHKEDAAVHPTQKPLKLIQRLVQVGSYPGELVVDPFCGSGTTAVAAHLEGRRCITCDLSEEYVEIAKGRIATAKELDAA